MERKIGEIFTYNGKIYQVVKSDTCANCAFRENDCSIIRSRIGLCVSSIRFDKTNVVFKEINNMEIKNNQLTIDIPEGMEIDLENSDLAKGIVRFKQSTITYEDVEDTLKLGKNCKSIIINESNASKLVALSRLMNIAKYYNGDWKPNWSDKNEYKYFIIYKGDIYKVDYYWATISNNIYFKNKKDAQAVTDEIFKINFCTSKFGLTQSGECTLIKFGNMYDDGECIIFPSKEMRDWSKFSWQKGDVLISNDGGTEVIFDKWYDDTYTSFYCKHYLNSEDKNKIVYYEEFLCTTERYSLEDKDIAQTYINIIEKHLGGKLNLETLEIEKQPKFKDGDILSCDEDSFTKHTTLILHKDENITESIVSLIRHKKLETNVPIDNFLLSRLYPAREDEKKELFDALAKGGKAWDAEKKIIVNLKHKCEFKPFDKVLGRNEKDDVWEADLFSHYREESQYPFRCIGFSRKYCIPYEGNEHLLGTRNNPE